MTARLVSADSETGLLPQVVLDSLQKQGRPINIRHYGARADGNDYTSQIRQAYEDAALLGRSVYWPGPGDYVISDTISPQPGVCTDMSDGASAVYNGSGTAFFFDKWSNNPTTNATVRRPGRNVISVKHTDYSTNTWTKNTDTTSVGVKINVLNWSEFTFFQVTGFNTGISLESDGVLGSSYNTFRLGEIRDNRRNIRLEKSNGGFNNSNTWIGGAVRHNNYSGQMAGTAGYDANFSGGNNDTFVNVCFEGSSVETAIRVTGSYATFIGGSYESLPAGRIKIESTAKGTTFFGGYQMYGRSAALISDNGINTVVHGEFGSTAYGDSARAGGGLNGAVGAYAAYVSSSSSDLLWTGHNASKVITSRLDGAGRLDLGGATFPLIRFDPTAGNAFGGAAGAVAFGRGSGAPDAAIGRSTDNQPAVASNVAILSKTQYVSASSAATTVNCYLADVHVVTVSANTTVTLALPAKPLGWSQIIHLEILQDATGGRSVTLPSDVSWAGSAPVLTTTASRRDIFVLRYDVSATKWFEVSRSLNVG